MEKKSKLKDYFKKLGRVLVGAAKGFSEDKAMKLSAALAYYTIFSIAPLIVILISIASIFLGQEAIQGQLFQQMNDLVGNKAAAQIQEVVANAQLSGKSTISLIIGVISLLIGATAVFIEIQDSINTIWKVRAVPKKGWLKMLTNRLLSFSMIITLAFLLTVSLIINGLLLALSDRLNHFFPDITLFIVHLINWVITFIVITGIFSVIFKVLPDVVIKWRTVRAGAIFTTLLFILGKYLISLYIEKVAPESSFGAAGSLIVLLVWVYYTAVILYFGAEFTQAYTEIFGGEIKPSKYAVHVVTIRKEKEVDKLPPQHDDETPY